MVVVDFLLVEAVVAAGEHVDSKRQQFIRHLWSDTETARGILRVGDYQVDSLRFPDVRQMVGHNTAAGMRVDIADEQNFHARPVTAPSDAELTRATYLANTPVG